MKNRTLIFESGKQVDRDYSAQDLKDIRDGYTELKYSAPWTLGHNPLTGSPAVGWVRELEVTEGEDGIARLYALSDFNPNGEELIKTGGYENKSVSLYMPEAPHNPNPGKWSLRHVAMLGSEPPALKTLGPILENLEYSDTDDEFVVYDCSCQAKPPTTLEVMKDEMKNEEVIQEPLAVEDPMALIAELRAELEALRAERKEELIEDISETEVEVEEAATEVKEATNEVETLKAALAKLQSELDLTKEANTALTVSSAISSYYSEGIITEDILPEATLTSVVSKLTLGFSNYADEETPLVVIEGLLNALNRNAPVVEYGETWSEEPKEVIEEVNSVSYSTGDEMHELAVATAGKYTLSYGKALTAIVQAKELSEAKKVDFSETLSSILTK